MHLQFSKPLHLLLGTRTIPQSQQGVNLRLSLLSHAFINGENHPRIGHTSKWLGSTSHLFGKGTLQGINISHLGKRKIIFKMPFLGDMLVPWRVFAIGGWQTWSWTDLFFFMVISTTSIHSNTRLSSCNQRAWSTTSTCRGSEKSRPVLGECEKKSGILPNDHNKDEPLIISKWQSG